MASVWRGGLDFASAVWGLIAGVVAALLGLWRWARNTGDTRDSKPEQVDQAAEKLLRLVRRQWSEEIAVRSLGQKALDVCWGPSDCGVTHYGDLIDGVVSGTTANIDGLIRSLHALRYPRLVVLGPGGSGKTVLAVLLMLRLAEAHQPGDRVPVLLALSSWDPQESLHAWMERRIAEDYSALARFFQLRADSSA